MWDKEIQEVKEKLNTSDEGLSMKESLYRLSKNGENKLPIINKNSLFSIFLNQFKSPIIVILFIAAIFSILTNNNADCIFIFVVIVINALIGTYQEWSSEKSAEKLQNMIKIKARVIRDGIEMEIDSENIVIGDIVQLESGNKVPADLRLVETNKLAIDESLLTGETKPKNKNHNILPPKTELAERDNIAFAGTVVTLGRGKGIVIATGKNTEFGKVADNVLHSKSSKSPLVIKMEQFTKQISIGFVFFSIILSCILYLKGYLIQEVLSCVIALTVSAIPEGLTIAMTIVLSISSNIMAKKNVIVKKLYSVESLGSCTVIATDKTGTLTANQQTAKKIILPSNNEAYIKGIGYNDLGEIDFENNIDKEINQFALMGYINNEATLKVENKKWVYSGDAIDIAFLALGLKANVKDKIDIIERISYEPDLKYSAVFYKIKQNIFVTTKGATEKILDFCKYMCVDGNEKIIDKKKILLQNERLAKEGFRVIAIAKSRQNGLQQQNSYYENDIKDLVFLGLVGFIDPIREGVIEAVETCKTAGITTIMITGDQNSTAQAIGNRIGINKIYSRATPMEKLEIVNELKKQGELVAVTGDGVNDSPALKSANIGVAMGSGSDIAKEVGNMIITDDNFSSIVKGVEEGRHAYNNIRKVVYLLLSTGFSEIILFILSIIFNLPIPLVAIQLLWLNLISNGLQGDLLAFEKDTEDVMKKKVKNQRIFDKLMIQQLILSSLVMAIIEFIIYVYLYKFKKLNILEVRTYLLTLMIFMENIQIFNCRSEYKSIFKISGQNNKYLIFSIIITCLIQLIVIRTENLANLLHLTTMSLETAVPLLIFTIPLIIVMELFKYYKLRIQKPMI